MRTAIHHLPAVQPHHTSAARRSSHSFHSTTRYITGATTTTTQRTPPIPHRIVALFRTTPHRATTTLHNAPTFNHSTRTHYNTLATHSPPPHQRTATTTQPSPRHPPLSALFNNHPPRLPHPTTPFFPLIPLSHRSLTARRLLHQPLTTLRSTSSHDRLDVLIHLRLHQRRPC